MENNIKQLVEEFTKDNDDVKSVVIIDKNGLPLNNSAFPKEGIPSLKFLSDCANSLKLSPNDANPTVTITTASEEIIVKPYPWFLVGVQKTRETLTGR